MLPCTMRNCTRPTMHCFWCVTVTDKHTNMQKSDHYNIDYYNYYYYNYLYSKDPVSVLLSVTVQTHTHKQNVAS